jgi:putative isomerase
MSPSFQTELLGQFEKSVCNCAVSSFSGDSPITRDIIALTLLMLAAVPAQPQQAVSPTATRNLETLVGKDDWVRLPVRLQELNSDIRNQGLHDFPGATGEMLTGYKYGEYYDWDLYFENLYLSYYGVSDYDLTNLKVFLDRQQPDGFISRTLGITYPKPTQMFKPFMAQLVVLSAKQNGNSYDWLRGNYYTRLQKYVDRWFEYDADHNGLPVWDSADASGMDNQVSRSGEIGALQDEGVDLACYLVRELQAMSMIARTLGDTTNEKKYTQHAKTLVGVDQYGVLG